jgi:FtsP/CotA-like multicopper oxidase with cupredoxin domain
MRILAALFFLVAGAAEARTVRYELVATRGAVNLSGKGPVSFALMLNGSIPAPTLELTEGDDAEITVRNQIPGEELALHWHGILLPPEMDGVPYLTTPPIRSGESLTFRYRLRQSGTYWYHSHTNVQEQKGLYGAIVIHPKNPKNPGIRADRDVVAVLSDWSDEDASDIMKNLRKDGDYYLHKKGTMRSWLGALQAGQLGTYLGNEWTRMGGMDLSDVGYDAFLINGKRELQLTDARPGERIRLRIVNAGASSYFHVALGQGTMQVVSADGQEIEPVQARQLLLGMAETYDVLFTVPAGKSTELLATAQDGTGSASAWIGSGEKVLAPRRPAPDLYAPMSHGGGHAGHGAESPPAPAVDPHAAHRAAADPHAAHRAAADPHAGHAPAAPADTLTVDAYRALKSTAFPAEARTLDLKLVLGGDMERYVWHINGKAIHEEKSIEVREGDVVRFTFVNETMMHHPMHLHGHFFRVVTGAGDRSPLKHTVDVPPHGTRVIEFRADEPGEWMLHCHNLFHMKTGMARVVRYLSYQPSPEMRHFQRHDPHDHDHWYAAGMLEAATNHAQAHYRLAQTWNQLDLRLEARNLTGRNFSFREKWDPEGDLLYRRWFGQYLTLAGGATLAEDQVRGAVGASYLLPFLIESQLLVDHRGKLRLDLEKRFQWTRLFFTDADFSWRPGPGHEGSAPLELELSLMYSPAWSWAAGLMLTEKSLGAGLQLRF